MDINSVNLTDIFHGLKHLATENLSLLELPIWAIKGIFSILWYLIKASFKGILWLIWSPVLFFEYYFSIIQNSILWIVTSLLTFVQVKFGLNLHDGRSSL